MKPLILIIIFICFLIAAGQAFFVVRQTGFPHAAKKNAVIEEETNMRKSTETDVEKYLAPYQPKIQATQKPVMRITLEAMPVDDLMLSKVGAMAYWPEGEKYPLGENGKPLFLLAQIRFDEMPAMAGYPSKGMLQFFIADTDYYGANFDGNFSINELQKQTNFRIHYWPTLEKPSQKVDAGNSGSLPHNPQKPRRMKFELQKEVISSGDFRFDKIFGMAHYDSIAQYANANGIDEDNLTDAVWERFDGSGHKMGGYPYFTQSDPRDSDGIELLFQLDSDDDMMWGDVGVANFFIRPDDLKQLNFSRVAYNWDCH
jgi:uncharacterized protein YwqG